MSEKPSLYVVEKKEVVILVVLFVLVTVLSFTLGVRYGESVGRKVAQEQEHAVAEHGEEKAEVGGTLGKGKEEGSHGSPAAQGDHGGHDSHGAHGATSGHEAPASPESEAKASPQPAQPSHEVVDKKSDEYLLNALKDAGVEPPGGKAPQGAKLPDEVKETKTEAKEAKASSRARSGSFVIQVGSHPTRGEAEAQLRQLKAKQVGAEVLAPVKDRQGEWHRVVIGGFKSKKEADSEAGGLKGRGAISSYFVWRLP